MHPIKDATIIKTDNKRYTLISIHAPYKGCNPKLRYFHHLRFIFQSMHPIKDATVNLTGEVMHVPFQSMHPIKDATKYNIVWEFDRFISIHAPYKGCNVFLV